MINLNFDLFGDECDSWNKLMQDKMHPNNAIS